MTSITLFGLSSFVNNNYLFSLSIGLIFVTTGLVIAAKLRKGKKTVKKQKNILHFIFVLIFVFYLH
jgi:chromate transport protein ChrA